MKLLFLVLMGVAFTHTSVTETRKLWSGQTTTKEYKWPFVVIGLILIVAAIAQEQNFF